MKISSRVGAELEELLLLELDENEELDRLLLDESEDELLKAPV